MKKKVLMIVYTLYPVDARVRREAETLVREGGFEVNVLTLKTNAQPRTYTLDGVTVKELNQSKYTGTEGLKYILSYFAFLCRSFSSCCKLFVRGKIDIVHVHNMPNFIVFAAILPRIFRKKVILDIHDTVPETFQSKFEGDSKFLCRAFHLEEKISCLVADKVICVNHRQRERILERGLAESKTFISMNVPDHKRFRLRRKGEQHLHSEGNFTMVYHGTIARRLGIDLAIKAVLLLTAKIDGLKFHIWGEGEFRKHCEDLIDELSLSNYVFFHNLVATEEVPDILRKMDLGIIGNRRDAATELMLPVKMLEYIALGIPVVVPRLSAIEYYFSEEMVGYFEPGNVHSIANAIYRLYNKPVLRIKQAEAAKRFLQQYGWQTHYKDFLKFYATI